MDLSRDTEKSDRKPETPGAHAKAVMPTALRPGGGLRSRGKRLGLPREPIADGMSRLDSIQGKSVSVALPRSSEEGSILVWALLFSIITSAMIISHSTYMAANRREMHVRYENVSLADSFARSGLVDSLAWFQRQPTQPVQTFTPQLTPEGDPPLFDTLDPTIGLVREFEVRGNLWARYEARTNEAFDISSQRGQQGDPAPTV